MLILDVLIAYVIKRIAWLYRMIQSEKWTPVAAKIVSSRLENEWIANCPTVYVAYIYRHDGQIYSHQDSKPFLFPRLAQEDAERFERGRTAIVRMNPQQPQRSVLRREDQRKSLPPADQH
jgi:hypothetical protein